MSLHLDGTSVGCSKKMLQTLAGIVLRSREVRNGEMPTLWMKEGSSDDSVAFVHSAACYCMTGDSFWVPFLTTPISWLEIQMDGGFCDAIVAVVSAKAQGPRPTWQGWPLPWPWRDGGRKTKRGLGKLRIRAWHRCSGAARSWKLAQLLP